MQARIRLEITKKKDKTNFVGILTITDLAKLLSSKNRTGLTLSVRSF